MAFALGVPRGYPTTGLSGSLRRRRINYAKLSSPLVRPSKAFDTTIVEAPRSAPPVIILPGFGNCSSDYAAPFGETEQGLKAVLERRGFRPYVLPLLRRDWFNVGRALFTRAYWTGSCTTSPGYSWYLERVKELVDQAREECGCDQVDLIAHSAGGWLGRAFIGSQQYKGGLDSRDDEPHEAVRSLITLGTPHTPPPPEKVRCATGGALSWVNEMWPGATFAENGVKYVSVGSRAVVGDSTADRKTLSGYAHSSYIQVCGEGDGMEGDAVVPLCSALLQGSEQVVLDGVLHSMSRIRTFEEPSDEQWYGSEGVVDTWLKYLAS